MTTMLETLRRHVDAEAAHDAAVAASTYAEDGHYENAGLGLRFEGRTMVEFQYAGSFESIKNMKGGVPMGVRRGRSCRPTRPDHRRRRRRDVWRAFAGRRA